MLNSMIIILYKGYFNFDIWSKSRPDMIIDNNLYKIIRNTNFYAIRNRDTALGKSF